MRLKDNDQKQWAADETMFYTMLSIKASHDTLINKLSDIPHIVLLAQKNPSIANKTFKNKYILLFHLQFNLQNE